MLALEMDLLTGAYRAALPDGSGPEWPPHPERVFSALVQAWGEGGRDPIEGRALEWVESLPPPEIEADAAAGMRDAPIVYVPPNDARGDEEAVLPERRNRQARTFAVAVPDSPRVRFVWPGHTLDREHRAALATLARRIASVGHSASLVRCSVIDELGDARSRWTPAEGGQVSLRVPHRGRLRELERWFGEGRRPQTGMTTRYSLPRLLAPAAPVPQSVFGGDADWFVFEHAGERGDFRPDVLGFAHVARRLREALLTLAAQPAPEIISGHGVNGVPSTRPHLAIVPLLNAGWAHANGDLLGFAIVLPRAIAAPERRSALAAIASFARVSSGPESTAVLRFYSDRLEWTVRRAAAPSLASLKAERYARTARTWATVMPMVLDRHPDRGDVIEEARIVALACRHVGLPEPTEIEIHKHSVFDGAPSTYPARGSRHRPTWTFPAESKLVSRPRRHVVLRFEGEVAGPLLVGAGRYHGFGLCLPLDGANR